MKRKLYLVVVPLLCLLVGASAAYADNVEIQLSESGYATFTSAAGAGTQSFSGVYGTFTINNISGTGSPYVPEPQLSSNSLNTTSTTGGTLTVKVTETGLTTLVPGFQSTLTSNTLPAGWTVVEQTWLGTGAFGESLELATTTFTATGTTTITKATPLFPSDPYSETEVYIITSPGGTGQANDTIDLTAVPEPASIAVFGSALLGLAGLGRRRFFR